MQKVDKLFFWLLASLVIGGLFIFISASLGLHAREGITFSRVVFNQIFLGLVLGSIALIGTSYIPYKFWRKYAFYVFIASLVLTLAVFIPGLGFSHGGATRWLSFGPLSFQPAELLKVSFVIYFATWLSGVRTKVDTWQYGVLPLVILLAVVGITLLLQPDTDTFLIIMVSAFIMYVVAGAKWWHVGALTGAGFLGIASLALFRPYIRERLLTFIDPSADPLGAGYQVQQSLIALGSGGLGGRGMGQSIQKFNYLPEPIGDSIFAVFGEEWGFIGCIILISLFLALVLRGFKIASHIPDAFGRLLVVGLVSLVVVQSFINMAAMLAIFPLTGMPLIFVSQGGTALLFAMASMGIVLNISKFQRKN